MNTEFVVRMPAATGRTALGREQVTWTETAKFGELMPVSGRDYEFANVLGSAIIQFKMRTWRDEITEVIDHKTNIVLEGKTYDVSHIMAVSTPGAEGAVQPGAHLIDIYFKSNQ